MDDEGYGGKVEVVIIMSENQDGRSIAALLKAFKNAIRNEEFEQAAKLLREIGRTYDKTSAGETRAVERSLLTRSRADLTEKQRGVLTAHSQQAIETELIRAMFLSMGAVFVAAPETADAQEMLAITERLARSERTLEKKRTKATALVADVPSELPPTVAILTVEAPDGPIGVGNSFDLTVVIGNIGDTPAEEVRLQTRGEAGLQVDAPPAAVGALDVGASTMREFILTGERPGNYTLTFMVSSANAGSATEQETVDILDEEALAVAQGRLVGSDERGPLDIENIPDWVPIAGGVGALGLGAGTYGYLRKDNDKQGGENE